MADAEVSVVPYPFIAGTFRAVCTDHGILPVTWADPLGASLDAMGHAAHHHRADPPP